MEHEWLEREARVVTYHTHSGFAILVENVSDAPFRFTLLNGEEVVINPRSHVYIDPRKLHPAISKKASLYFSQHADVCDVCHITRAESEKHHLPCFPSFGTEIPVDTTATWP